jgi:hypothetical protein
LLAQEPFTQYPQSQSASFVQLAVVQPWLRGSVGVVHRVFSSQVHPSSQGISSHWCTSARAPAGWQRDPAAQT